MLQTTPQPPARQLRMDFRLPERRPLWHLKACMTFLECTEDEVMALIDGGTVPGGGLEFAFDLRGTGAGKAFPVVWQSSVLSYLRFGKGAGESLETVINNILGADKSIRSVALKSIFGCVEQGHVAGLVKAGELAVDATRPVTFGRAQSPWITRASAAAFLRKRRMM